MPENTVLMILKTTGLEYDDRVRKECASLRDAGAHVSIFLLADDNRSWRGWQWDHVAVRAISLIGRSLFAQGRGLAFKTVEFNIRAFLEVLRQRPDVVWIHNEETTPVVALSLLARWVGVVKRVVWDQHELPSQGALGSPIRARLFSALAAGSDTVVSANRERVDFLREKLPRIRKASFSVLENFPDAVFRCADAGGLAADLEEWLGGRPFLVAQGGAHPGRHFETLVEALMGLPDDDLALVVIGGGEAEYREWLDSRWEGRASRRVFFTGWIPQMETPAIVDRAVASVVLYEDLTPNSKLCAPNRLYQAITRGTPVIAGANPPMKSTVERYRAGVVLPDDGASVDGIRDGIIALRAQWADTRLDLTTRDDGPVWEVQYETVREVLLGESTAVPLEAAK